MQLLLSFVDDLYPLSQSGIHLLIQPFTSHFLVLAISRDFVGSARKYWATFEAADAPIFLVKKGFLVRVGSERRSGGLSHTLKGVPCQVHCSSSAA